MPIRYSLAHGAFGVTVASGAAQGDDQGRNAAMIEGQRMVEPGTKDRGRLAVVLRRTKTAMASEGAAWSWPA